MPALTHAARMSMRTLAAAMPFNYCNTQRRADFSSAPRRVHSGASGPAHNTAKHHRHAAFSLIETSIEEGRVFRFVEFLRGIAMPAVSTPRRLEGFEDYLTVEAARRVTTASGNGRGPSRWQIMRAAISGRVRSMTIGRDRILVHRGDVERLAAELSQNSDLHRSTQASGTRPAA